MSLTCAVLFGCKVLLDDGAELRAEVVAVEPPLKQGARRPILNEVPAAVYLRFE